METLAWIKRSQPRESIAGKARYVAATMADTSIEWMPGFKSFLNQFGLPPGLVKTVCDLLRLDQEMLDDLRELRLHFAARLIVREAADASSGIRTRHAHEWGELGVSEDEIMSVTRRASSMSPLSTGPGPARVVSRPDLLSGGGGTKGVEIRAKLALARNDLRLQTAWLEGLNGSEDKIKETEVGIEAITDAIAGLEAELAAVQDDGPFGSQSGLTLAASDVDDSMVVVPNASDLDVDDVAGARALSSPLGANGCGMVSCRNGMYFGFRHTCRLCYREVCSECTRWATVSDIYLNKIYVSPQRPRIGLGYVSSLVDGRHPVCKKCKDNCGRAFKSE